MTINDFDIKVGHGTAQVLSIMGMVGGWGASAAAGIAAVADALPKNAFTAGLIGAGVVIGGVSNWMLTQARKATIQAKVQAYADYIYHAAQYVEKETGIDIPVVEPAVVAPPTI